MAEPLAPGTVPLTVRAGLADGHCRTIDELDAMLPLTRRQISAGAAMLMMRGQLERVEIGCYRLTPAGRDAETNGSQVTSGPFKQRTAVTRPRRDTLLQRAWTAMRMSSTFTISDLVMAARRDETDARTNLSRYLSRLTKAGYVAEMPVRQRGTRLTSNGFKRYRLLRDTGPNAPMWSGFAGGLVDRNGDRR